MAEKCQEIKSHWPAEIVTGGTTTPKRISASILVALSFASTVGSVTSTLSTRRPGEQLTIEASSSNW